MHVEISQRIIRELGDRSTDEPAPLPRPSTISREKLDLLAREYLGRGSDVVEVVTKGESLAVVVAGKTHPARVVAPDEVILEEGP